MPTYFNVRTPKKDLLLRAISDEDKQKFVATIRNNLKEAKYSSDIPDINLVLGPPKKLKDLYHEDPLFEIAFWE